MKESTDWFCVKSHPKHERIAAEQLALHKEIEVFCPRIRFKKKTKSGSAWITEALFPSYLFARFEVNAFFCLVRSARGVNGIVHFGGQYPLVPDAVIKSLRESVCNEEILAVSPVLQVGDAVTLAGGVFHGLQAVVHRIIPAQQRVGVLLELLGQTTLVELNISDVLRPHVHPLAV